MATANQNAQGLVLALFNAAAGGNLANLAPLASTASATNALGGNLVAVAALVTGKNLSDNTTFRDTMLANLQITSTNAAYANAKAWVDGQLATPGADKGTIAGTAVTYLLSLTDATNPYYAAAKTFQARNDTAVTWSTSTAGSAVLSATTLIAQQASVDNYVAPPPPVVTTNLTASTTDSLVGNGSSTTFTGAFSNLASANTLQTTDKIDGVSGTNTLKLDLGASWTGFTSGGIKNVGTIAINNTTNQALAFDVTGTVGANSFSLTNTTGRIDLTNVASGTNTITLNGGAGVSANNTFSSTFASGAAELTGTTDVLALNLNAVGAATSTVSGVSTYKYNALTLNSFETINATSTGANFVAFAGADLKALNFSGSGALTVLYVPTSLTSFDASKMTGNVTATLGSNEGSTTYPASLATINGGSGDDTITAYLGGGIVGNATVAGGAGANKLTLTAKGDQSTQFTMSGIQTLEIRNGAKTVTFSGANTTGLTTITVPSATYNSTTAVQYANMGTGDLVFNAVGSSSSTTGAVTAVSTGVSSDNSGVVTLNENATSVSISTATVENNTGVFAFSKASTLNFNVNPFINSTGNVTANLAATANVNILSGLNASGVEQTNWNSVISLPVATSFNLNATGQIGAASGGQLAQISAPKATSATITNGASTGVMYLNTPLLNTLNVTTGNGLDFTAGSTTSSTGAVQALTVATTKGLVKFGDLPQANNLNFSGAGSTSAVTTGSLGGTNGTATTNGFDLNVTATGLKGNLILGKIQVTAGNKVNINASGVTGSVTIGTAGQDTIGTDSATTRVGDVTISDNGPLSTFSVGNVWSTGTVNINANGTAKATVGSVKGSSVTVNVNGTDTSSSVGDIVAKSLADITFPTLKSGVTSNITLDTGSTASTVNVKGTLGDDVINITSSSTTQTSITVTGDLSIGANKVVITNSLAKAVNQTIDISKLTNYTASYIVQDNMTGNNTIIGGPNSDTIYANAGTSTYTGGAGADYFYFQYGQSPYNKIATITDFTKNDGDTIQYGPSQLTLAFTNSTTAVTVSAAVSGVTSVNTNANDVTITPNGFNGVTFSGTSTDFDTIAEKVQLLHKAKNTVGASAIFQDSGSTYLWIDSNTTTNTASAYTTDTVIKLVGVAIPATAITLDTGNSTSGITGYGA